MTDDDIHSLESYLAMSLSGSTEMPPFLQRIQDRDDETLKWRIVRPTTPSDAETLSARRFTTLGTRTNQRSHCKDKYGPKY
jgi:hypothetical protein